jgi:hypothetical protein
MALLNNHQIIRLPIRSRERFRDRKFCNLRGKICDRGREIFKYDAGVNGLPLPSPILPEYSLNCDKADIAGIGLLENGVNACRLCKIDESVAVSYWKDIELDGSGVFSNTIAWAPTMALCWDPCINGAGMRPFIVRDGSESGTLDPNWRKELRQAMEKITIERHTDCDSES